MTTTPYLTRFSIFLGLDGKDRATEHDPSASRVRNPIIRASLVEDVNAVLEYRARSDRITKTTIRAMFSRDNPYVHDRSDGAEYSEFIERVEGMIDENRDFIYTKHGLNILKNRYLFDREPVQIGMLRAAKIMTKSRPDLLKECYDLLSCGFVHISSIIASADLVVNDDIRPGEACRLMVAKDGYDQNLISQIENVCKLICLGVGVGLGVSNLPANGKTELGQIRSGFMSLVERLNSCNFISLHERKPKIALYLHVHNDTVRQALTIKMPSRVGKINNVFIGLMIPNHFMDCVKDDKPWYLFPGDMVVDGKNLANLVDDEYIAHFERCVDLGLYTQQCQARDLMRDILQSLVESGAPYIIWSDHLNRFNNQKAYGTIKTLNLCAEITNYANSENDSSCTLLSCNMAMWKDFPNVFAELRSTLEHKFRVRIDYEQFDFPELAEYAYTIGYYGTVLINGMFGEKRARREIGLNPLGVYDMALMADRAPDRVCATISEALYRGAVTASCDEYDRTGVKCSMYDKSEFAFGRPQFVLRS